MVEKGKNYINTIDYECQKKFKDLLGVGGQLLSYDFIVYKNNEPYYLIECQGKQHYEPVEHFGGEDQFKIQQKHDNLKKEYAIKIETPLLEIPYTANDYKEVAKILKDIGI